MAEIVELLQQGVTPAERSGLGVDEPGDGGGRAIGPASGISSTQRGVRDCRSRIRP